jgi:hypothetical protein
MAVLTFTNLLCTKARGFSFTSISINYKFEYTMIHLNNTSKISLNDMLSSHHIFLADCSYCLTLALALYLLLPNHNSHLTNHCLSRKPGAHITVSAPMSPSPPRRDGVGEPTLPSPARSIKFQPMEDLPLTNVIDLTLDSDDDEVSEIPRTDFFEVTDFIKKESDEPAGISDDISEIEREDEREVTETIEMEGASTSAVTRVTPQTTPLATPEVANVPDNVAPANTSAEASAPENVPVAYIPPRPIAARPLTLEELIARDQELDAMLRDGTINIHAYQNQNPQSTSPQQSNNANRPSTPTPTLPHINDQAADTAAAAEFQKLKKRYEARKQRAQTSFSEDIEYEKACQAEENRVRLQNKKRVYAEREAQEAANDERLFFSDIERSPGNGPSDFPAVSPGGDSDAPTPKRSKTNRVNKIPPSALQESMRIGLDAGNARSKKSAKRECKQKDPAKKKVSIDKVQKSKGKKDGGKAPKKKGRPHKGPEITNIGSLLNNDLIADAQANQDRPGAPGFTSDTRKDALKELIASMPADQQKLYTADRTAIDKACRSFSGVQSIKARGSSGWLLRGMRSALQNYQLLGT